MTYNFLLVGNPKGSWRRMLQEAVSPLGDLQALTEDEARTRGTTCNVVIVDSTEVEQVEELVIQFSSQLNPPYIIVVTEAPSWGDALKVFRAGATDCIRKYNEKDKLAMFFHDFLSNSAVV